MHQNQTETVRDYYARVLKSSTDLQTSACCTAESLPDYIKPIASAIHPEVLSRFYGCGSPIPLALEGKTILDLGCGSGRDCYIFSKLVGESGSVIGIDMTGEQLDVAKKFQDYHRQQFGYQKSNVSFRQGYIEDLRSVDIADASVDVVVSNCVINLSPDKLKVFSEIMRVLKPGGELYFSDVFSDRRIPKLMQTDPVMLGECLGGAMYTEDFRRLLIEVGIPDFRVFNKSPITITNSEIAKKAGNINFRSITIRAFKVSLEDKCEDYGQIAYYLGTIPEAPHRFILDDHHIFETGKPYTVCSNTANMLKDTRFAKHFRINGDTEVHYGLYDCTPSATSASSVTSGGACC